MRDYLVITFHTTSEAMATERACRLSGLEGKLIPVPRSLSAGCGIAWRTMPELKEKLEAILTEEEIEWEAMSRLQLP